MQEMDCPGDSQSVLSVSTDEQEAFSGLQVGKHVRVSKAPPQGQAAMNGSTERSVRASKRLLFVFQKNCECKGLPFARQRQL